MADVDVNVRRKRAEEAETAGARGEHLLLLPIHQCANDDGLTWTWILLSLVYTDRTKKILEKK